MPEPYAQDNLKLVPVAAISPLPLGLSGQSITAGATSVSITPPADKTAYVTGFEISGGGATAASVITAVLSGLSIPNMLFSVGIPAGAAVPVNFQVQFTTPIVGAGKGQTVTLLVPSFGAGNVLANTNLHGFAA